MFERLIAGIVVIGLVVWGGSILATPDVPHSDMTLDGPIDEAPSDPFATGDVQGPAEPPTDAPRPQDAPVRGSSDDSDDDRDDDGDDDDDEDDDDDDRPREKRRKRGH